MVAVQGRPVPDKDSSSESEATVADADVDADTHDDDSDEAASSTMGSARVMVMRSKFSTEVCSSTCSDFSLMLADSLAQCPHI